MNLSNIPKKVLSENELCSGFSVKKITPIENIRSIAYEMVHKQTKAKLVYIQNEDKENLFSVAFKTPPPDNTGLPHILEHSVLCGSKTYPVKDPFVELLKSSLATFLNAMTYPDKTVYPCASMNEEDFHNILRVYCDAVFFPLLTESYFKQEGHHYRVIGDPKNKNECALSIQGVVYNEMKGVYSDLDGIMSREESRSILPDNCYGKDSGGDPNKIPLLTYKKFKEFHDEYYHPSNSYIIVYGSFDIKKTLAILHKEYLSKFTVRKINPIIGIQKHWKKPVSKEIKYPLNKSENLEKKTAVTVNFLTNNLKDVLTTLSMTVLEQYLLSNSSSPLRKALIDSGYGEGLTSSGYADFQRDTFFTIGLKNIRKENVPDILKLIISTCKKEAENGFNKRKLDSVFHKLAMEAVEIQSSYPLVIMERIYDYWIYGEDPFHLLNLNKYITELQKIRKENKRFFENLLVKYIVNNKHYSVLTFIPDPNYHHKSAQKLLTKLTKIKNSLSEEKLLEIKKDSEELEKKQGTVNSPEALSTLPCLSISRINKKALSFKRDFIQEKTHTLICNDVFSNGINYVDLALDISSIPDDLLEFLSLFQGVFLKMGTSKYTYAEMAEREALFTGGVKAAISTEGTFDNPELSRPYLLLSSKALDCNIDHMFQIVSERLKECDFSDTKRLKDVMLQMRVALRGSIISGGSSYALSFASQNINRNTYLSELFGGISHLRFLNKLTDSFDANKEMIVHKLNQIKEHILNVSSPVISFTGTAEKKKNVTNFCKNITPYSSPKISKDLKKYCYNEKISRNGIIVPAFVAYNAGAFKTVGAQSKYAPALLLISSYLSYNYLWYEIRAKRGAYGASAVYSLSNGTFGFSTYRDPHIKESYNSFENSLNYPKDNLLSKKDLEQAIIGTLKKLDKPIRPEDSAITSLSRHIRHITDEKREELKSSLLNLTKNDIDETIETVLKPNIKKMSICSISGKQQLDKANDELKNPLTIEELL